MQIVYIKPHLDNPLTGFALVTTNDFCRKVEYRRK